jgi:hypothetical protein
MNGLRPISQCTLPPPAPSECTPAYWLLSNLPLPPLAFRVSPVLFRFCSVLICNTGSGRNWWELAECSAYHFDTVLSYMF